MRLSIDSFGRGANLALLHGWGMHSGVWHETAWELARHFRVHLVDLPGHGASRGCEPRDLDELVRAIGEQLPGSVYVCGWSLGAIIALAWARLYPQQLRKLALIAATPSFAARADWRWGWSREALQAFERDLKRDADSALKRFLSLQVKGDSRESLRKLRQIILSAERPSLAALGTAFEILQRTDLRHDISQVTTPTLVMHGDCDAVVPVSAGEFLAATLMNAKLRVFPRCGHAPFLSQREKVLIELVEFFDG